LGVHPIADVDTKVEEREERTVGKLVCKFRLFCYSSVQELKNFESVLDLLIRNRIFMEDVELVVPENSRS